MIDRHRVEPLRAALAGEVILPADAGYEECRKIFNAMHDKRPAVIARCRSTADVVAAVDFARKNGLLVAVRLGGHSVAGLSVCADGILIDLSGLKTDRGRCRGENRPCGRRRALGRIRRRHPAARTAHAGRPRHDHRRRRVHHRRRLRLDVLEARPDLRQPALRRGRAGGRSRRHGQRARERGSLLGHSRRRRQLRHRHRIRVPAPSARTDRAGRPGPVADRARPRSHARMARLRGRRSRRALDGVRRHHRSARAVRARVHARAGGARHGGHVRRRSRRGREGHAAAQGPSTCGRSHPADAVHGIPGDDRSDGPEGVSQLLAGRVPPEPVG